MPALRLDVEFDSGGETCRAWWYEPAGANLPSSTGASGSAGMTGTTGRACVVMAHGLGGVRTAGLEPYAERLAAAGLAVLVFDYRHFGASGGLPRQLVSIPRQLADWAAAIAYARSRPGVDAGRIALWGSSFSGGHVVVAAARDARVAALCAQGPMMDGLSATLNIVRYAGPVQVLRLAAAGLRDVLHAAFGRARVHVPLVGAPGTLATMTTPDAEPGYLAIAGPGWENRICASFALALSFYRPVLWARRGRCPALLIVADDSVAPAAAALRTAQRIGARCELHRLPMGHFDIYRDAGFERGVGLQVEFLQRALGRSSATAGRPAPAAMAATQTAAAN